jgi:hypothetical protein
MLLHQNLERNSSSGVPTGVELCSAKLGGDKKGNNVEGIRDGVLLLHGQGEDMRKWFGHKDSDEQHDAEELTVNGRRHSRDPTRNGVAEQWLASGE